jgi:hypothetical protein
MEIKGRKSTCSYCHLVEKIKNAGVDLDWFCFDLVL